MTPLRKTWRELYDGILNELTPALAAVGGKILIGKGKREHWFIVRWKDGTNTVMFLMLGRSDQWTVDTKTYDAFREALPTGTRHLVVLLADRTRGYVLSADAFDRLREERQARGTRYQLTPTHSYVPDSARGQAMRCFPARASLGEPVPPT